MKIKNISLIVISSFSIWTQTTHGASETTNSDFNKTGKKIFTITSDPWCPYVCDESNKYRPGYIIEIAKSIFTKAGYQFKFKKNEWAKAVSETVNGNINAIAGATASDRHGLIFTDDLGSSENCFVVLPEEDWVYKNVESLKSTTLGAIDGYTYNDEIDNYIKQFKQNSKLIQLVSGARPLQANWQKLRATRIRTFIEDKNVFEYYAKENNITEQYKYAGCYKATPVFIGFGEKSANSENLRELFRNGLFDLRISGELSKILIKYNIKSWK